MKKYIIGYLCAVSIIICMLYNTTSIDTNNIPYGDGTNYSTLGVSNESTIDKELSIQPLNGPIQPLNDPIQPLNDPIRYRNPSRMPYKKELTGVCNYNKYYSNTLPLELKKYLEYYIFLILNKEMYSIIEFIDINEQIDINNNRRYLINLYININSIFSSKKIFIDFVIINNQLHVNSITNVNNNINIIQYPHISDNINSEDYIHNNNINIINIDNNDQINYIATSNKNIQVNDFQNCNQYVNDNRFCYKDSINWDKDSINFKTGNSCLFNNNGSYEVPYNRTNYPNDYTINQYVPLFNDTSNVNPSIA